MSNQEAQEEELEVLKSIYEADNDFKSSDDRTFQYKFGTEGEKSTVLIEIQWHDDYPEKSPHFNLNTFYNNHLSSKCKAALLSALEEESIQNEGCQQTYTIIEWARESFETVIAPFLSDEVLVSRADALSLDSKSDMGGEEGGKVKVKKEQLTKSQKRKEWDRVDSKGEKPRGYDWVDIVKHLSQTGGKPDFSETATTLGPPAESYLTNTDLPS